MRIVHVTAYFAPAFIYGGPPRSILGLCKALQRAGVESEVVTTTANGEVPFAASGPHGDLFDGVPVRYLPLAFPKRFFAAQGLKAVLTRAMKRADLLHVHGVWNVAASSAMRLARKIGWPYIVSPRGMLSPHALHRQSLLKRIAYTLVEGQNLRGAALLHATSATEANTFRDLGLSVETAIIPNGVDVIDGCDENGATLRRRLGIAANDPILFYLGRIHPIKRLDLLATAFKLVQQSLPEAQWIIAGPDEGGHWRTIESAARRSDGGIHWTGALEDAGKAELFAAANVGVTCSDSESFGLSVLETLAAGVPVVVAKTCPWQEIETYGCGRWVEQSPAALAAAIVEILSHPLEARAMGDRGRAYVSDRFGWDAIARTFVEYYESILRRRRGTR